MFWIIEKILRSKLTAAIAGKKAYIVLGSGLLLIADQALGTCLAGEIDLGSEGANNAALVAGGLIDLALLFIKMAQQRHFGKLQTLIKNGAGVLIAFLMVGCMKGPISIEQFDNPLAGEPNRRITVDPTLYGRGCTAVDIDAAGNVSLLTQQDGTSDWIGVRILEALAADAVAAVMVAVTMPIELIGRAFGLVPALQPPSEIHGCDGIFGPPEEPDLDLPDREPPTELG